MKRYRIRVLGVEGAEIECADSAEAREHAWEMASHWPSQTVALLDRVQQVIVYVNHKRFGESLG